jgi:hypothetical protein
MRMMVLVLVGVLWFTALTLIAVNRARRKRWFGLAIVVLVAVMSLVILGYDLARRWAVSEDQRALLANMPFLNEEQAEKIADVLYTRPTQDLITALEEGDIDGAQRAVGRKADVNAVMTGRPIIFHFIRRGRVREVEFLLSNGADVQARTAIGGRTPLHEAALYGRLEIAKALLEHGADVNAKNPRGETPLFYAEGGLIAGPVPTQEHHKVAELLRQHGGVELGNRLR